MDHEGSGGIEINIGSRLLFSSLAKYVSCRALYFIRSLFSGNIRDATNLCLFSSCSPIGILHLKSVLLQWKVLEKIYYLGSVNFQMHLPSLL